MVRAAFTLMLLVLATALTACGTIATPVWRVPTQVARVSVGQTDTPMFTDIPSTAIAAPSTRTPILIPPTLTPTLSATPTSVPTATATLVPDVNPETVAEVGDPAKGQVLFNTFQPAASFACATCHYVDREEQLIGPGLLNVARRAETRVDGLNVVEYIRASIINPGAYVVSDFPDGLMPRNWAEIYSDEEINDLIAYLFTLH